MGQNQVKENSREEDETSTPILMGHLNANDGEKEVANFHQLAFRGYIDEIRRILDCDDFSGESIVRKLDALNKTPVHNAAMGGGRSKTELVSLLLKHDQDDVRSNSLESLVDLKDIKGKTVLHYAAASRRPDLIAKLLNDFGADPNIVDLDGQTPLHISASQGYSEEDVTCLEILLKSPKINRYQLCGPSKFEQSPVHLAANAMADKVLKHLLNNGFDYAKEDSRGLSPLHLAVSAGDTPEAVTCVKELLRVCNIKEVNARSQETGQTALHMAAYKCHVNVLRVLLEETNTDVWVLDNQKRTALHWATEAWFRNQSLACVKLLVESEKVADWQDKAIFLYGDNTGDPKAKRDETAMDIAIKHKAIRIAEYLIQAHPSPDAWLDDKMLENIYKTLPEAMIPLMNNKGLTYNPAKFHERNESIDVEFGSLTGYKDLEEEDSGFPVRHETKYLHSILHAPKEIQQSLLLHPLIQIFIDRKWKKIQQLTWIAIIFQFIWLLLYTVLVFEIYVPDCKEEVNPGIDSLVNGDIPKNKTKTLKILLSLGFYSSEVSNISDCVFNTGAAISIVLVLYGMSAIVAVKEIFQMLNNSKYFRSFSNWAQWTLLIVFFINSIPAFYTAPAVSHWQIYLAAFGMFVGWVLSLREIAKFPNCGIYSAILKRVFWHCLKMLVFYIPLLVAFSLSLRLLLPGKGQYNYLFFGIVKVLIMMTGELDFEDSFYKDDGPQLALNFIFGQFVFLLLVFITTIVLLNLLTGLAVNDVQSLIEEAEINRLSNELEQIFLLESLLLFIRDKLGKGKLSDFFHKFNVTSISTPYYYYFTSKISGIETRSYSQDLKKRIKSVMTADESDG